MKKTLLLTTLFLTSCTNYYATIGGHSHHFKEPRKGNEYNESHDNLGFGAEDIRGNHQYGSSVQYYKNSFNKDAMLVTTNYAYKWLDYKNITNASGFGAGFGTGYNDRFGKKANEIQPFVGGYNELCYIQVCLYNFVAPNYGDSSGLIFGGLKIKIN